ncbi:hypothetical protein QA635_32785 [Bradyrhizobium brasilense]|uniref:hypothetical protein n=1 Tax=Bradyrhizobium brasilense TaxID=1419277 RepID=UPI0024B256F9|nr:hypothetical protein [Bradyrhizobium australafricanum]WFU31300.1 hypothetical protein QA635_32785 [Bradyrhizobium australafricanum]
MPWQGQQYHLRAAFRQNTEMKKTRRELLKFSGPTTRVPENLRNRVLYCQHYERFKYPFEFWTDFRDGIPDLKKGAASFHSRYHCPGL